MSLVEKGGKTLPIVITIFMNVLLKLIQQGSVLLLLLLMLMLKASSVKVIVMICLLYECMYMSVIRNVILIKKNTFCI